MRTKHDWVPGPSIRVINSERTDNSWRITAIGQRYGVCLGCGNRSMTRHSWYVRGFLEKREVADVLAERSAVGTADWLGQHPEVEIVSRDRCGLYAQGARAGAPQARQVADRFHLIQNLRETIQAQLSRADRSHRPADAVAGFNRRPLWRGGGGRASTSCHGGLPTVASGQRHRQAGCLAR